MRATAIILFQQLIIKSNNKLQNIYILSFLPLNTNKLPSFHDGFLLLILDLYYVLAEDLLCCTSVKLYLCSRNDVTGRNPPLNPFTFGQLAQPFLGVFCIKNFNQISFFKYKAFWFNWLIMSNGFVYRELLWYNQCHSSIFSVNTSQCIANIDHSWWPSNLICLTINFYNAISYCINTSANFTSNHNCTRSTV